jgi:hypothetical protein
MRGGNEPGSEYERNPAVLGKEEVIIHVALTAKPEMFNLDFRPNPARRPYHSAIAKIMELLAACGI